MPKVEIPKPLKDLLDGSDLQAPLHALADRVSEILADNKLAFFPDYTDHGTDHINQVLQGEVDLVPVRVWERCGADSSTRPLVDVDAVVIIGATLLHDIAMHVSPEGFQELVREDTRFRPLPWFKEDQEGHSADRPWTDLWQDYTREARRFSGRTLGNIIGQESMRHGWKFQGLPADRGRWELNHRLFVGEFLRRHHARLAHEIAIYGFPGLPVGSGEGRFPALGSERGHPLIRLADLIGLTARSHGTSLRVCKAYLDASPLYPGTPRPMGAAVLYAMSLLRVADYLQIDRKRAPAILLHLRNPQSPISVKEWKKHLAVQSIGPATDPRGKTVTVSTDLSLELYLQLCELVAGLQGEMDHSSAVLDEAYGTRSDLGLDQLGLATRRVYSNIHSPAFRNSLPYVPERTGFSADPNLLTLLVEPLYGKEPAVGVRELMQNAVDAVRELHAWCGTHGKSLDSLDLPEQEHDVLIEFIKRDDDTWILRVSDKGIGMREDTIQKYFLRAGASFRQSPEWEKDFLDEEGHSRVLRAGRFGVGVFAIFLLGPNFRLRTRHAATKDKSGYAIEGAADSDILEIQRVDGLPVGTTIEVEITSESVARLKLGELDKQFSHTESTTDWFCWDWPTVSRRIVRDSGPRELKQRYTLPLQKAGLPPQWSLLSAKGFDAVFWTSENAPSLTCNGILISEPQALTYVGHGYRTAFKWPEELGLMPPRVAVLDSDANLPLTTQRYALSRRELPFTPELTRDVILSFIAHSLVCGPESYMAAVSPADRHPLHQGPVLEYEATSPEEYLTSRGRLHWCMTSEYMVPADPWLYSLLQTSACVTSGVVAPKGEYGWLKRRLPWIENNASPDRAHLQWDGVVGVGIRADNHEQDIVSIAHRLITEIARAGIGALGHVILGSRLLAFVPHSLWELWSRAVALHQAYDRPDENWSNITPHSSAFRCVELITGTITSSVSVDYWLAQLEPTQRAGPREDWFDDNRIAPWHGYSRPSENVIRYVAEIHTGTPEKNPESLVATIWNECLGARAIPFDSEARRALIEHGRRHPELKRHIEAWEGLQCATSK